MMTLFAPRSFINISRVPRPTHTSIRIRYTHSSNPIVPFKPLMHTKHIGFVFDIDGVLLKGRKASEEAFRALKLVYGIHIPYIILTNGGGVTEQTKTGELNQLLNANVDERQVVLAHSPMRAIVPQFKDKLVLVIGKDSCKKVALSYGFKRPVLADELIAWNPTVWPFRKPTGLVKSPIDFSVERFGAILVFHDSLDWGRDIQLIVDLLRSKNGLIGTEMPKTEPQSIPIFFSNPDFVWSNEFPVNRFAQGAFRRALETLYKESTDGQHLDYVTYGKPERTTYEYAYQVLLDRARAIYPKDQVLKRVYMIGDNPASDILGANNFGWESMLVRTGVWKPEHGDNHGAKFVVNDVFEAVKTALEREKII